MLKRMFGRQSNARDTDVKAIVAQVTNTETKSQVARRKKIEALQAEDKDVGRRLKEHFDFNEKLRLTYKASDKSTHPKTVAICEAMIRYSPKAREAFRDEHRVSGGLSRYYGTGGKRAAFKLPMHPGFKQLAIIREKQGQFDEAIRLSEAARDEGWNGDWTARISRLKKKL